MILQWVGMWQGVLTDELYDALMGAPWEVRVDTEAIRDVAVGDYGWKMVLFTLTGTPELVSEAADRVREVYRTAHGDRENGTWWGR